jgi:hypothetical protein
LANEPPVLIPTAWACRSISPTTDWNSEFNTARSPVKVPDADCVASVFKRSSIWEMLLMPPSTIWSCETPSLA